ncbi:hypothetical protein PGB90_005868 [Kerria lacca]
MEVTGQAFEDMQEQNSRLIQQLREKDEANFKLMTERIKSNQLYKVSREEKEILQENINVAHKQLDSINNVVHKLEEKEKIYQTALSNLEKEMLIRQQALELHKRKAIENAQSAADLKLHLEKYHAQMKEAQQIVSEKTSALEAEAYKNNRLQEEIAQLKRKVERMKKIEAAGTPNIVLMEEIKEYKETLTCPSCKVKRKDAVLTKCFHVFCWDCLKARYETRQRKCPKCNAAFGANDYHRLYLDVIQSKLTLLVPFIITVEILAVRKLLTRTMIGPSWHTPPRGGGWADSAKSPAELCQGEGNIGLVRTSWVLVSRGSLRTLEQTEFLGTNLLFPSLTGW